jgi:arylsulfatase A-like enzyme
VRSSPWLIAVAGCLLATSCDKADPSAAGPAPSTPTASAVATSASSAAPSASAGEEARRPLNVILLTIDSLRSDMPWQGLDRDIAPHLTALAKESVVYPRAYAVSSYTAKSAGAILGGKYPSTLYRGPTFFTEYSKANLFLPEVLSDEGVRTLAGHAHLYFDRSKNLRQGFDVWKLVDGLTWNAETDESVTSPKMTALAKEMLGDPSNTKSRFFTWLHYMDPHDQYVTHAESPKFGRRAKDLYHNEIYFTDLHVHDLLSWCDKQPWWKDTVLIVSSDHGEAFGEHDQWKHAFALWEVLTRVPLMVKGPGMKPRTIDARRSHIDLAPTILELTGVEPPEGFEMAGKSLVPELYGAEPEDREPILLDLPADTHNPPTRAIVKGDWKLIQDPGDKYKLYNLKEDPDEVKNLVDHPSHAADFERVKKIFDEAWAKHPLVLPYGGSQLKGGARATGPKGPPGYQEDE